jgi:hypothetical protein
MPAAEPLTLALVELPIAVPAERRILALVVLPTVAPAAATLRLRRRE